MDKGSTDASAVFVFRVVKIDEILFLVAIVALANAVGVAV